MEHGDPFLARIDQHMAEGNDLMRQTREVLRANTRAFEDLRSFLGEMTEVLHALVGAVNQNSGELREQREELREELREQREELREDLREQREELREQRRAFREESQAGREALLAILDQLRGGGPGTAPAT